MRFLSSGLEYHHGKIWQEDLAYQEQRVNEINDFFSVHGEEKLCPGSILYNNKDRLVRFVCTCLYYAVVHF